MTISIHLTDDGYLKSCPVWWKNFMASLDEDRLEETAETWNYLNSMLRQYNASKIRLNYVDFDTEEDATRFILTWI
jgi:hypothetical protein